MKFFRRTTPSPSPTRRQRLEPPQAAKRPSAFSYAAGTPRQPAEPGAAGDQRLGRFWLARTGLLLFLIAITALAVNLLSLAPSAKVLPLNGGDQSFLRPSVIYATAADAILRSSPWNRLKPTINTAALSQQLLQQFPELTNISVTIPLAGHQPLIYIQPVEPAVLLRAANGSFIVDTSGKAVLKVNATTQLPPKLPVLTDESGLNASVNRPALPQQYVDFIRQVVAQLAAKQYTIADMSLPAVSSELQVHLQGQPYLVKFNLQDTDPRGEAGTFLATIATLKKQNVTPSQYVDVRVPGRAYYK